MPTYRALALLLALFLAGCASSGRVAPTPDAEPAPPAETVAEEQAPADATAAPNDWFHLDAQTDGFRGVSAVKAYGLLQGLQPKQKVIVAVIDSGIDIAHEDLDDNLWTNADEIPGNGVDDDQNGYADDVHGWSFIGGPGGNVEYDTFEVTREYARLRPKYENADPAQLSEAEQAEYAYYQEIEAAYMQKRQEAEQLYSNIQPAYEALQVANQILRDHFGTDAYTMEQVAALDPQNERLEKAQGIVLYLDQFGLADEEAMADQVESAKNRLEYGFDLAFDPRPAVGDDYADPNERLYGSSDVAGPDPFHGTHVAGIIAAERGNGLGIDGIAPSVQIMVLRAVPNGDERDKDVANAIRYAIDNGAQIINMSFGKSFSPDKAVVDEAVRYAEAQGVLLIHGAGNDGEDLDRARNFPTRTYLDGGQAANWIEVGASSWKEAGELAAPFSNYGRSSVDVFAPGVDIYSTVPGQGYEPRDGTSMAAPVVTGVAALIMAYYPELTAVQVRDILLKSAIAYPDQPVQRPGGESEALVDFGQLSQTGGIVNAYAALKMAQEMVN